MAKLIHSELTADGLFLERWYREGDQVYRVREDVGEAGLLEFTKRLRAEPEALRDAEWGRWALSIPLDDYDDLVKRHPELASHDREIKHRAYQRFMKSDESIPYRVYPAKRGRTA